MSRNKASGLLIIIMSILILSSCNKKYTYLYQKDYSKDSSVIFTEKSELYKLKTNDVLHISITSNNEELTKQFKVDKQDNNNLSSNSGGGNFYLTGFTIDPNGDIEIPVLGKIHVGGKTISEARQTIIEKTNEKLVDAIVNVKLVSFKFSTLGKFNSEKTVYIYQEKINILEAISTAGGLSQYADLRKIQVLRENENGKELFNVDLTNQSLLSSNKFYIYPNDIIIAGSLKSNSFRMNLQEYMYILSALTTSVSTIVLILQLKSNP
jgi:polysaccharide export outer membrane protein